MFDKFISRENQIFEILQEFVNSGLEFAVVGGYAVSAYKHRFSVDADVVIRRKDQQRFVSILLKNDFVKTISKELKNVYFSGFVRYEKKTELPVSIDLLVGGVMVRQTGAVFGYDLIRNHSERKLIKGMQKEVSLLVPKKEMLIVMKLHAGRATDFRDAAALCKGIDLSLIKKLICIGNVKTVKEHIAKFISLLSDKQFIDSFKGVFIEKKYDLDVEEIKKLAKLKI